MTRRFSNLTTKAVAHVATRSGRRPVPGLGARRGRVDVARERAGAPGLLLRPGAPVRGRAAPRHRHRRGCRRPARARTHLGRRQLRGHGSDERQVAHDRHAGRARGDADEPRLDLGRKGRRRRRGGGGRHGRAERDAGGRRSLPPPRDPDGRRCPGLPRPARVPAGCGRAVGAASSACSRRSARCGASGRGGGAARRGRRAGFRACGRGGAAAGAGRITGERGRASLRAGAPAHRGGHARFATGRGRVEPRRPGRAAPCNRRPRGRGHGAACAAPRGGRRSRSCTGRAARAPGACAVRRGAAEAAGAPVRRAREAPACAPGRRASAVARARPGVPARPARARSRSRVRGGSYDL